MIVHELKILPKYFKEVKNGNKTFEIRKNDRGFEIGDLLKLREWENEEYTGNEALRKISYILDDETYLQDGYVALGIFSLPTQQTMNHKYI